VRAIVNADRAEAAHLERHFGDPEAGGIRASLDRSGDRWVLDLGGISTGLANQKLTNMILARVLTPNISLQRFNFVNQTMGLQEIQSAIDRRRRGWAFVWRQRREDLIGAHWHVTFPYDFQDPPTLTGQSGAANPANRLGAGQGAGDAMRMVMFGIGEGTLKRLLHGGASMVSRYYSIAS
jgi:hypothetical protein